MTPHLQAAAFKTVAPKGAILSLWFVTAVKPGPALSQLGLWSEMLGQVACKHYRMSLVPSRGQLPSALAMNFPVSPSQVVRTPRS